MKLLSEQVTSFLNDLSMLLWGFDNLGDAPVAERVTSGFAVKASLAINNQVFGRPKELYPTAEESIYQGRVRFVLNRCGGMPTVEAAYHMTNDVIRVEH
jgi:hypothetical protein